MRFRAQGATEYLVLLAVVLIIALVGIALLGFFPGTAGDAQIVQSEAYWRSTSPVAISEWAARCFGTYDGSTRVYMRLKNNGQYPLRITALLDKSGNAMRSYWGNPNCSTPYGAYSLSGAFYLAPGEEKNLGWSDFGFSCNRDIALTTGSTGGITLGQMVSLCQNSTSAPGTLAAGSLGFEYVEYIEGQEITKRQIGEGMAIRCLSPV